MHLHGYDPDWLSEPARFDRGCTAIGVDPDEWRTRIESEQDWFALHSRAFAPERLLGQPDVPNGGSRPLLVDGATCGCSQRVVDGVAVEAISWVQKQDRRHTFADHDQIWPTVAASLDGDHTVDRLRERFDLREDAINMLSVLHGLGFVAYV